MPGRFVWVRIYGYTCAGAFRIAWVIGQPPENLIVRPSITPWQIAIIYFVCRRMYLPRVFTRFLRCALSFDFACRNLLRCVYGSRSIYADLSVSGMMKNIERLKKHVRHILPFYSRFTRRFDKIGILAKYSEGSSIVNPHKNIRNGDDVQNRIFYWRQIEVRVACVLASFQHGYYNTGLFTRHLCGKANYNVFQLLGINPGINRCSIQIVFLLQIVFCS